MKPSGYFNMTEFANRVKDEKVQFSEKKIKNKIKDLLDIFDVDRELFKRQIASDVSYNEYRKYTVYRKYGDDMLDVLMAPDKEKPYGEKRVKNRQNEDYYFPEKSFNFLLDWCRNYGKDKNCKALRNHQFNKVEYLTLKEYVDKMCSMIESLDVEESVKEGQRQRVYARTRIDLRAQQQELMQFCTLLLYKLNVEDNLPDDSILLDLAVPEHQYYMYEPSVLLSTEDMKQFLNMVITDYKACMYRHDKILNLMIKLRAKKMNEVYKQMCALDGVALTDLASDFKHEEFALSDEWWQRKKEISERKLMPTETITEHFVLSKLSCDIRQLLDLNKMELFYDNNVTDCEDGATEKRYGAHWKQTVEDFVNMEDSVALLEYVKSIVDTDIADQILERNPFISMKNKDPFIGPF